MDIFDKISGQIRKSEEDWKTIDELITTIKARQDMLMDKHLYELTALVLLLAEQIRPMGNLGQEASKLQHDIAQMLGALGGGKKK